MRTTPQPLLPGTGRPAGVLPVVQPAASFLTLPRLAPTIPQTVGKFETGDRLAELAAALAELGILRREHLTGGPRLIDNVHFVNGGQPWPLPRAIECAIKEWIKTLFGGVQGVDPNQIRATLTHDLDTGGFSLSHEGIKQDEPPAAFVFSTVNDGGGPPIWLVGEELTYLETTYRGWGRYLLSAVRGGYMMSCQCFDPADARNVLEWCHWHGGDDEKYRIELDVVDAAEWIDDPERVAQFCEEAGIITRARWDAMMPTWAWQRSRVAPQPRVPRSTPDHVRAMFDQAVALHELIARTRHRWAHREAARKNWLNDALHAEECVSYSSPIILRWNKDDMVAHLFDEGFNFEYQNGSEANLFDHAAIAFDAHDRQDICEACLRVEDYAALMRATGDLLIQFATRQH